LLEGQKQRYAYMGLFSECATVLRTGKWAQRREDYNGSVYPLYALGPGYILSAELAVETASAAASDGRRLFNEDVSVGSWVHIVNVSEATPVHVVPIPSSMNVCSPGDVLTLSINSSAFGCMWERWRQGQAVCCGDYDDQEAEFPNRGEYNYSPCGFLQTCELAPGIACGHAGTFTKDGNVTHHVALSSFDTKVWHIIFPTK